jgi:hypothetical protein
MARASGPERRATQQPGAVPGITVAARAGPARIRALDVAVPMIAEARVYSSKVGKG